MTMAKLPRSAGEKDIYLTINGKWFSRLAIFSRTFFYDLSMHLPECSKSDRTLALCPIGRKPTDSLREAVSTENPRITGD
jgi:hypothetical protein